MMHELYNEPPDRERGLEQRKAKIREAIRGIAHENELVSRNRPWPSYLSDRAGYFYEQLGNKGVFTGDDLKFDQEALVAEVLEEMAREQGTESEEDGGRLAA